MFELQLLGSECFLISILSRGIFSIDGMNLNADMSKSHIAVEEWASLPRKPRNTRVEREARRCGFLRGASR